MKQPVFRSCYSDWKLIKSRGVVQIVLEVPIAESDYAYEVLGGMPRPDAEIWCGVARLNPGKEAVQDKSAEKTGEGAQRRDWADLSPAQQAGIICGERPFWRFLLDEHGYDVGSADDAADAVRSLCGVTSRRDIALNQKARVIWHALVEEYRLFMRAPEVVP